MKRHTLFTLCILLAAIVAQAAPITIEKARENALAFLTSGNMQQRVKGNRNLNLVYTRNEGKGVNASLFHVFNIGDDNGFVIASADDVAVPVLGYCDRGAFDLDDIPVNMQAWLDGYEEEISKARENGVVPKRDAPSYSSRKKINPMIKSTWDQDAPYNDMCIFDGTSCVTGCVATGMAQIMYYWAKTGVNGKKFRCGSTALPAYTTYEHDYAVGRLEALASFDWDSMTDGRPTTTKGKSAVAQLMRYCGQAVNMDYGPDESGISLIDAAEALQHHFDYNYGMKVVYSRDMTEQEWQELVYNELDKGCPFLMSGFGYKGGHAFICDGYDPSNGKFHFNWGWGGDYDGWFAMTSLNPDIYYFNSMRSGIKSIQPFSASTYATLSSDGKTLSFYCDTKRRERTEKTYWMNGAGLEPPLWSYGVKVEHVVFDKSFSEARPVSTYCWFDGQTELKDITGLSYLNTSDVTTMGWMFNKCGSLESIDVSHFDTSKVKTMLMMFCGCSSVKRLDVSRFDTSNVTYMDCMFEQCSSLKSLDVSHFNTSKVKDMGAMFYNCNSLESLDIRNFDMSNVSDVHWIFTDCNNLSELYIPTTLPELDDWGCLRVGTSSSPCRLHAPAGFDFGFTPPTNEAFQWKRGWFVLVEDVFAMGDVNHDGQVNITDISLMVDHVLGSQPKVFHKENADMNHDGQVNVTDISLAVDATLGL